MAHRFGIHVAERCPPIHVLQWCSCIHVAQRCPPIRPTQAVAQDFCGEVTAVGSAVAALAPGVRLAPGDTVFGNGSGCLAQWAVADAASCAKLPAGLPEAAAAALPTAGLTGLQALREAGLKARMRGMLQMGCACCRWAADPGGCTVGSVSKRGCDWLQILRTCGEPCTCAAHPDLVFLLIPHM